jgi:NitT/TauT family transport system ATP-binding protein
MELSPPARPTPSPGPSPSPIIELRNVGFTHQQANAQQVLAGVDLAIGEGELFVLVGPSGCGKTTLLNLIAGFERPSVGAILVRGAEVRRPGADRTVIFQGDDSLAPWLSARKNVELGLQFRGMPSRERQEISSRYLELTGLAGHGHKYPSQLSGGMKQRVQLARALACSGPILLMDEPFGAVDAQTRATLQDELVAIARETARTIVFITHDIFEAVILGDRVGVMSHGPNSSIKAVLPLDKAKPRLREDQWVATAYGAVHAFLADGSAARAAAT